MIKVNINKKQFSYKTQIPLKKILSDYYQNFKDNIIAVKNESKFLDLNSKINSNADLKVFDQKHFESLQILRHSCAHLMCNAIYNLFPEAKSHVGPVIKNGFYYDIYYERKFNLDDINLIENEMKNISKTAGRERKTWCER